MTVDAHANFSYGTVLTAPSPATSGVTLVLNSGQGVLMPAVPFNATVWPVGVQPVASNAEIVRCTARSTDTCTITRAQEGTAARAILVGDQFAATITAKVLTDIEARRDTLTVSYVGSGGVSVYCTVYNPSRVVISPYSRSTSGVSETSSGWYEKVLSGLSSYDHIIVRWDEGDPTNFAEELITIPR